VPVTVIMPTTPRPKLVPVLSTSSTTSVFQLAPYTLPLVVQPVPVILDTLIAMDYVCAKDIPWGPIVYQLVLQTLHPPPQTKKYVYVQRVTLYHHQEPASVMVCSAHQVALLLVLPIQ
jgi:hypothetical protein